MPDGFTAVDTVEGVDEDDMMYEMRLLVLLGSDSCGQQLCYCSASQLLGKECNQREEKIFAMVVGRCGVLGKVMQRALEETLIWADRV